MIVKRSIQILWIHVVVILLAASAFAQAQVHVSGVVQCEDGIPKKHVLVKLRPVFQSGEELYAEAELSGEFSLNYQAHGIFHLSVTAPFAEPVEKYLYIEQDENVEVDIFLSRQPLPAYNNRVTVFGSFNDYAAPGLLLKRKERSLFTGSVDQDSGSLDYAFLIGTTRKKDAIPDPKASEFVFRDGVWYARTAESSQAHSISWTFDEKQGQEADSITSTITCLDTEHEQRSMWLHTARMYEQRLTESYREYSVRNGSSTGFKMDWEQDVRAVDSALQQAQSNQLRRVLLAAYAALAANQATISMDTLRTSLDVIPMASPLWAIHEFAGNFALSSVSDTAQRNEYLHQMLELTVSERVGAALTFAELVVSSGSDPTSETTQKWYTQLLERYPKSRYVSVAKKNYNPGRRIVRGKKVPAFSVVTYPDSLHVITDSTLLGKVYLIDFWATWCGPCVGEMPVLHKAYEQYGPQGLEMLSISFDRKQEDMERFISGKWTMPWTHTFVSFKDRAKLSQDFEVSGIPKPVLVDENGTILASGSELRGEGLLRVLESVFGEP